VTDFARDMARGEDPYWLTLSGLQGTGKTMLARQVYQYAAKHCNPGRHSLWLAGTGIYSEQNRRPRCVWFTASEFRDQMLSGDYDLPEYLRADYLVAIDDLGTARDTRTDAVADGLYRLADNRVGRWMIWTTNLTLPEIAQRIDPRISSRLVRDSNRICTINCGDYALRKGAA